MSPTAGSPGEQVRVLQSFPGRGARTNPYLLQLLDSMPNEVSTEFFSWRVALTGSYDVLHVHWPERFTRGTSAPRTLLRRLGFLALLARLRLRNIGVLRTVHNPTSHESGDFVERRLLRGLDARTTIWHRLNPLTEVPAGSRTVTIPHGHYRDWFAGTPERSPQADRVLFFGLVRPYKGVEELISAFSRLKRRGASLRVMGQPATPELAKTLAAQLTGDNRASASWGYASDEELAAEVRRAQLVVLPYRELHNSGAALLALSLNRPILVPDNEVTRRLRADVGADWVHTYQPPLSADHLAAALAATATAPADAPRLDDRGWDEIGALHAAAYRLAAGRPDATAHTPASREKEASDDQPTR